MAAGICHTTPMIINLANPTTTFTSIVQERLWYWNNSRDRAESELKNGVKERLLFVIEFHGKRKEVGKEIRDAIKNEIQHLLANALYFNNQFQKLLHKVYYNKVAKVIFNAFVLGDDDLLEEALYEYGEELERCEQGVVNYMDYVVMHNGNEDEDENMTSDDEDAETNEVETDLEDMTSDNGDDDESEENDILDEKAKKNHFDLFYKMQAQEH